jgi:hypothetical protein
MKNTTVIALDTLRTQRINYLMAEILEKYPEIKGVKMENDKLVITVTDQKKDSNNV